MYIIFHRHYILQKLFYKKNFSKKSRLIQLKFFFNVKTNWLKASLICLTTRQFQTEKILFGKQCVNCNPL